VLRRAGELGGTLVLVVYKKKKAKKKKKPEWSKRQQFIFIYEKGMLTVILLKQDVWWELKLFFDISTSELAPLPCLMFATDCRCT
jgi:hypothetical protein